MSALSEAVVLYIGWNLNSHPDKNASRVTAQFGAEVGVELLARVEALIVELGAVEPDWDREDEMQAAKRAVAAVQAGHPELDAEALAALEWLYVWSWK